MIRIVVVSVFGCVVSDGVESFTLTRRAGTKFHLRAWRRRRSGSTSARLNGEARQTLGGRSLGRPPAALHRAFGPFAYHSTKCLQSGVNTYELSLFSNERQLFVRVETRAELDAWYHMGQLVAKENFLSRTEH